MVTTSSDPPKAARGGQQLPWIHTPLLESKSLSKAAGCKVYMKMDMFQPAGSFKSRGIGNFCLKASESRSGPIRFYSSSGGNAGLAAVTTARLLGHMATVVVPTSTTALMKAKITAAGGLVHTFGATWNEADEHVRSLLLSDPTGVYCSPFDDPDIWAGNATVVHEIIDDLDGVAPDAIVVSVGGGGLLCGIQMALADHGALDSTPVLAVEPEGAASLNAALTARELVTIPTIATIAASLGAKRVAQKAFELGALPNVRSVVLSDAHAAMACCRLMDDERVAVEPACGISAAAVYYGALRKLLPTLTEDSRVVVIVCGGSSISAEMIVEYRKKYGYIDHLDSEDTQCCNKCSH